LIYMYIFGHYHDRIVASEHYTPAQQQARRRSSWTLSGGRRAVEGDVSATDDKYELAAATAALGQQSPTAAEKASQEQAPELLTAMVTGDVAGNKKVKGLPAAVSALISLYEKEWYWCASPLAPAGCQTTCGQSCSCCICCV